MPASQLSTAHLNDLLGHLLNQRPADWIESRPSLSEQSFRANRAPTIMSQQLCSRYWQYMCAPAPRGGSRQAILLSGRSLGVTPPPTGGAIGNAAAPDSTTTRAASPPAASTSPSGPSPAQQAAERARQAHYQARPQADRICGSDCECYSIPSCRPTFDVSCIISLV